MFGITRFSGFSRFSRFSRFVGKLPKIKFSRRNFSESKLPKQVSDIKKEFENIGEEIEDIKWEIKNFNYGNETVNMKIEDLLGLLGTMEKNNREEKEKIICLLNKILEETKNNNFTEISEKINENKSFEIIKFLGYFTCYNSLILVNWIIHKIFINF